MPPETNPFANLNKTFGPQTSANGPTDNSYLDTPDNPFRDLRKSFGPTQTAEPVGDPDIDPTWADYGRIVMAGGAQIGAGIGWLFDSADWGQALKEASTEGAEWWMEGLTPNAKAALQVEFTKRDRGELWTEAKWSKAKLTAAQSLLGTMAGMGVGSLFTKGLAGLGMRTTAQTAAGASVQIPSKWAGAIGYGAGEAGVAAPSMGAGVEDQISQMSTDDLQRDSVEYRAIYDSLEGTPEDRARRAKEMLAKAAAGDAASWGFLSTFLLSAPFGTLMGRMSKGLPLTEGGGRLAGAARGGAGEATQEFLQSGAEQIGSNIQLQRADPSIKTTEGALEQAVGGFMAGGLMGAAPGFAATPFNSNDDPGDPKTAALNARLAAEESARLNGNPPPPPTTPPPTTPPPDELDRTTSTIIPETKIDPLTGKPVLVDALDAATERANSLLGAAKRVNDIEAAEQKAVEEWAAQIIADQQKVIDEEAAEINRRMAEFANAENEAFLAPQSDTERYEQEFEDYKTEQAEIAAAEEAPRSEAFAGIEQQRVDKNETRMQQAERLRIEQIRTNLKNKEQDKEKGFSEIEAQNREEAYQRHLAVGAAAGDNKTLMGEELQRAMQEANVQYPNRNDDDDDGPSGGSGVAFVPPTKPPQRQSAKPDKSIHSVLELMARDRGQDNRQARLNAKAFLSEGLDPADMATVPKWKRRSAFITKGDGGMTAEDLAEFLSSEGFVNPESGTTEWTGTEAAMAVIDEASGNKLYHPDAQTYLAEREGYERDLEEHERSLARSDAEKGLDETFGTDRSGTRYSTSKKKDNTIPPGDGGIPGLAEQAKPAEEKVEEQGDMIGAGNKTDLAIHERNRKQAEKQAKAPAADMNVKGDMFTGTGAASAIARQNEEQAAAQTDVEDAPAKRKEEKEIPLREASTSDLEDLAAETEGLIEKYIEKGETGGGLDQTEILGGIQKLKLHNHPRAADLERVAKDAIAMHRKKASKSDLEDLAAEAVEAEEYAQELDEQGQKDLAFIERQHEKWRQLLIKDENAKLPATTVNIIKGGIEDFAKAGHPRTFELAKSHDHWTNFADGPIKIKSNDPYYKKARKTNKVGSVQGYMVQGTNPDGRHINISIDGNSWTVPYNSLTFETPKDKARLDWLISVYVAESSESPASTGTFVIDEEKFAEWGVDTEERVFDSTVAKKNRKAIDTKLKGAPFLSMEEADKVVQGWEDHAIAQRDQRDNGGPQDHKDNFNRVILSLFDTTGTWANPYALAGYDVRVIDIKNGVDIQDFSSEYLEELFDSFGGKEVYGVLAACPCTTFSNSGTRWRESRHDNTDPVESRKIIEEMWGTKAAEAKNDDGSWMYASANDYGNELVAQTMRTLEYYRPKFWALENPEGRIQESAGLPDWRTGFQPHNFGEPYTKRTLLFGEFNEDLPTANVEPTEGSKMHKMSPSEDRAAARAETPVGFSYAFFMANNYLDADPLERTKADYWYVAGAIEEAFKAGVTEDEIRNTIEPDSDYEGSERESALEALRELIEGAPGKPTPPPSGSTLIEGVEAVEAYKKELAAIPSTAEINAAAAEADPTSATEAQKKAGNYKKGHLKIAGLDVAIENPIGTKRHGNLKLRDHYGYIKRTEGADADQIDVFVNEKAAEDFSGDIYIVDQMIDGKFDEHKVMLGYNNMMDARRAYKRNYNKDWKGAGNVSKMTLDEFKAWLALPGANNKPAANAPVGVESPAFKKMNKDIRYASGRDLVGAPTNKWIETVLSGGERKMGDMPDSVPLNIAVSELLKMQQEIKTGKPAPAAPVRLTYGQAVAAVAPVEKAMPGAPMEVLASYKQAPKPVRDRMEADGMTEVRAVFDPQTNKIYLFADQALDANDAVMTALHEKTHLGLRKAFGAKLDPLLDDIFKNVSPKRRADMQKIADQYNLDVGRQEDRRVMAEELLAHMAEHDVSDGIVNRAIAFIRKLLRDMGFVQEFNDNDIRAMIREAQGAVSRAEDRIAGVTLEEEVILDETGEVFIIEQQADQVLTGLDQRIKICEKLRACL